MTLINYCKAKLSDIEEMQNLVVDEVKMELSFLEVLMKWLQIFVHI